MGRANDTEYQAYLRSPHWCSLAARVKLARGSRCERCGDTECLDAHHLTYDRIGHELMEDLMVLCRECHEAIHDKATVVWAYPPRYELSRAEIIEYVPDFEEGVDYSDYQLELLADRILLINPDDERPVLFSDHLRRRHMREIYVNNGSPDPSIVEGLYWRTHPQGRAWWSARERAADSENKNGFYRDANASRVMKRDYPYEPDPFKPSVEARRPKKTFVMGGGSLPSAKRRSRRASARKRCEKARLDKSNPSR